MSTKTLLDPKLKAMLGDAEKAERMTNAFELVIEGKKYRYGNMKIRFHGKVYHSLSEALYAYLLHEMYVNGSIKSYQEQVIYRLPNIDSKMTLRYVADFVVIGLSGTEYIIDVKGWLKPENKIKYAYFKYYYNKDIHLVFNTGDEKFRTGFIK
jgi:hypothetical protein